MGSSDQEKCPGGQMPLWVTVLSLPLVLVGAGRFEASVIEEQEEAPSPVRSLCSRWWDDYHVYFMCSLSLSLSHVSAWPPVTGRATTQHEDPRDLRSSHALARKHTHESLRTTAGDLLTAREQEGCEGGGGSLTGRQRGGAVSGSRPHAR